MSLSKKEYLIIKHCLGMDNENEIPWKYYRNKYYSNPRVENYSLLCEMVDKGLLEVGQKDVSWRATNVGITLFEFQFNVKVWELIDYACEILRFIAGDPFFKSYALHYNDNKLTVRVTSKSDLSFSYDGIYYSMSKNVKPNLIYAYIKGKFLE